MRVNPLTPHSFRSDGSCLEPQEVEGSQKVHFEQTGFGDGFFLRGCNVNDEVLYYTKEEREVNEKS